MVDDSKEIVVAQPTGIEAKKTPRLTQLGEVARIVGEYGEALAQGLFDDGSSNFPEQPGPATIDERGMKSYRFEKTNGRSITVYLGPKPTNGNESFTQYPKISFFYKENPDRTWSYSGAQAGKGGRMTGLNYFAEQYKATGRQINPDFATIKVDMNDVERQLGKYMPRNNNQISTGSAA